MKKMNKREKEMKLYVMLAHFRDEAERTARELRSIGRLNSSLCSKCEAEAYEKAIRFLNNENDLEWEYERLMAIEEKIKLSTGVYDD